MMNRKLSVLPAMLACTLSAATMAAPGDALTQCVALSPGHQATRFGSQYLFIKDGAAHYRVGFGGTCDALAVSAKVQIQTDGVIHQLCPSGTVVAMKLDTCEVRGVKEVGADEFERYVKRARR